MSWPERPHRRLGLSDRGASLFAVDRWGATLRALHTVEFAPGVATAAWQPALAPLSLWLQIRAQPRTLRVTLSDRLTRWQIVPWPAGVRRPAELQAVVGAHFEQVYGRTVEGWSLRLSDPVPGHPVVACAIDSALLQALEETCASNGVQLTRVEPYLVGVVRHWRRTLRGSSAWLAVVEPGHICLARVHRGRWESLRTQRCGESWQDALAGLRARVAATEAQDEARDRHYLAGVVDPQAVPTDHPWHLLQPTKDLLRAPAADRLALGR